MEEGRTAVLETINAELSRRKLKRLPKLGDRTKGEIEIVGIKKIIDDSARFFTDVIYDVVFPNGSTGTFTVRSNANSDVSEGATFVAVINGKFAIVKQWRLTLGRWTYEVPRGFGEAIDKARVAGTLGTITIADLPLATLFRELGEEVTENARIDSIAHLGNTAENSGTHANTPANYLVQITVPEHGLQARLRGSEELKVDLWDTARINDELGHKLCDNHTITALTLARRHIERMPRI